MPNLVEIIKIAAMEAVNESKPTAITFGDVVSLSPLKIQVDQKLVLSSAQLILTNDVRDHEVEMTINFSTEETSGGSGDASFASHTHACAGKKTFIIHNALKVGDKVIMVQVQGGQKYLVLEKVVNA